MAARSVLHLLPHEGAGAQTYLRVLGAMDGYRFETLELSASRRLLGAVASAGPRLAQAARRARSHDLVHAHGEVASMLALPLLRGRPSVVTLHGLHLLRRAGGTRRGAAERALRAVVGAADRTICVSNDERRDAAAVLPAELAAKLVVVRNGLPVREPAPAGRRAEAREALRVGDDQIVALYAGQLEERKDPLTALRAVRAARQAAPNLTLLVAGDGPLRRDVEREAGPGVRVLGQRDDVDRLLAAADVFVLPSRREGLSYALLEAMAAGLPAVVADGPGNAEAVGDAGMVAPADDPGEMARALERLASDPGERQRLGKLARKRVTREFPPEAMIEGTRAVYDAVLGGP